MKEVKIYFELVFGSEQQSPILAREEEIFLFQKLSK
jgi:hypothetical protein